MKGRKVNEKNLSTRIFGKAHSTYKNKYDKKKVFSVDNLVRIIEAIKNKIQ